MSSIIVKNVGKAYKEYPSKLSRVIEWIFPFLGKQHSLKWVLKDINFDIKPGEAVGVVGINGAGKSTLLKMITGTSQPTIGTIEMQGRVAALLELGMGFHPEFTGRENAYMSGQLLGITKQEMDRFLPNIEAFAEIGDSIDMPVRVYSSGMQVRLAFSVATVVRPDVLIVDEALSVGDIKFQQKCLTLINKFKALGTTVIFVTHDLGALYNFCDRAIYLNKGAIKSIGDIKKVTRLYQLDLKGIDDVGSKNEMIDSAYAMQAKLKKSLTDKHSESDFLECQTIYIEIQVEKVDLIEPHVGFQIKDKKNNIIYETNTYCLKKEMRLVEGKYLADFKLENNLCEGEYTISFGLADIPLIGGDFQRIILDQVLLRTIVIRRFSDLKWSGYANMRAE